MDIFKKDITDEQLRLTNKAWNDLKLNSPWSVGLVSRLMEQGDFKTKEEWEDFYYNSGSIRMEKIKELPLEYQVILLDPFAGSSMFKLPKEVRDLNLSYGRTKVELNKKGYILCGCMQGMKVDINVDIAVKITHYRVVRETWNGIAAREKNTIEFLSKAIPEATFKNVDGHRDAKYAIDYEIYIGRKRLAGLQIKPKSYMDDSKDYIKDAMELNEDKNNKYTNKYGVGVIYAYSKISGELYNSEIIDEIMNLITIYKKEKEELDVRLS